MTVQLKPSEPAISLVEYPESDGRPMAETDLHRDLMFYVIHLLRRYFAGQQVYVSGNLLLYYQEGNPRKSVAPDCFVVWGVAPHRRNIYKLWEEGQGPKVVFEVTSKTTQREDQLHKMGLYARLGVEEYYLYDPTADYLDPPLLGYQQAGGGFVPMPPQNQELVLGGLTFPPEPGEPPEYISPLLGLRLALDEENVLRFFDLETGQRLLTDEEARAEAEVQTRLAEARVDYAVERAEVAEERAVTAEERAMTAEERAMTAEERAMTAEERAMTAEERAERAEAESVRLRAELARLRGQDVTRP
ncbi:MAG: Uma2 family endonuclease [Anaerolinea sp.]|nr:Uma2 family endonuclease [Anaerolinea sp.]HRI57700.1 Uma2 family endonuclease [Anaerolineae bacterium]